MQEMKWGRCLSIILLQLVSISFDLSSGSEQMEKEKIHLQSLKGDGSESEKLPEKGQTKVTVDEVISKLGLGPFQILISVFCGLLILADAMELMILSILSPAVKCLWGLSNSEEALITSIVFIGFFLGGFFWGFVFDIIGRKKGLFVVDLVILTFGLLSAFKLTPGDDKIPGYPWLLMCRFGVGFGAGGIPQVITYYTEFLPTKGRGVLIAAVQLWWGVGTMFGAALAIGVMGEGGLGWHWYLGLAAVPLALVLFFFPFIPESARFYLVKGKTEQAQKVIRRVAFFNFKKVPPGELVSQEDKDEDNHDKSEHTETMKTSQNSSSDSEFSDEDDHSEKKKLITSKKSVVKNSLKKFSHLFTDGMWRTTLILICLWLGAAGIYYGTVLLTTSLLEFNPHCDSEQSVNFTRSCEGNQLDTGDYVKILWAAAAEFPGTLFTIIIIEVLGRKITISIEFAAAMIGFLLLNICASDILLTFFLFIIRAFGSGVFQAIYVYTPEVYPTNVRAFGLGVCSSAARIGAIATPYIAQVLFYTNDYASLAIYATMCLFLAIAVQFLPIETKGRALRDKK